MVDSIENIGYPDIARVIGTGFISAGLGLLAFVFLTITWGDPFTRFAASSAQKQAAKEFGQVFSSSGGFSKSTLSVAKTRLPENRYRTGLAKSKVAGRIRIPAIGLKRYVIKGTRPVDLEKGPGFYTAGGTFFPGSGKPVAIAGHRTTWGAPFLDIDKLRRGDLIHIDMPYGRFVYRVTQQRIISPSDWSIIDRGAAERAGGQKKKIQAGVCPSGNCEHLVLTACHPKYSAERRIAVFAKPIKVQARS